MKPPFAYFGGKTNIAERIVALLPDHEHYVEPYCGSLSVLLAKRPSKLECVNDLDRELVTFWRVLRDRTAELERVLAMSPHSRAEYLEARDSASELDELETARRVFVVLTQGRASTMRPAKTGWRHFVDPHGTNSGMTRYLSGYLARVAPAAERLRAVSLECLPALDIIAKYGSHRDTCLYVDPPYLGSVRAWGMNYKHEMKDDGEHRELAEALNDCSAAVVLSGYPSALYDELYAGWDRIEIAATTGNGVAGGQDRTEVLWSNRPIGAQPSLFDLASDGAA